MSNNDGRVDSSSKGKTKQLPLNLTPDFAKNSNTIDEGRQSSTQQFESGPLPATSLEASLSSNAGLTSGQANSDPETTHVKPKGSRRWKAQDELRLLELHGEFPDASWEDIRIEFCANENHEPRTARALEIRHHDLWLRDETIDSLKQKVAAAQAAEEAAGTKKVPTKSQKWTFGDELELMELLSKLPEFKWDEIQTQFNDGREHQRSAGALKDRYREIRTRGETMESLRQKIAAGLAGLGTSDFSMNETLPNMQ